MNTFGRFEFGKFGSGISCSADGSPVAKIAGVEIAWNAVPAVAAAYRFKDEDTVEAGEKFIRYGTMVCRLTAVPAGDPAVVGTVGMFVPYQAALPAGYTISTAEGDVFLINRSVHEGDVLGSYPEALDGGRMYIRRLLVVGYGDGTGAYPDAASDAADLAALGIDAMPAATFKTALPQIYFVTEGNPAPAGSTAV